MFCKIPETVTHTKKDLFWLMVSVHSWLATLLLEPECYSPSLQDVTWKGERMRESRRREQNSERGTQGKGHRDNLYPPRVRPWTSTFINYALAPSVFHLLIKILGINPLIRLESSWFNHFHLVHCWTLLKEFYQTSF